MDTLKANIIMESTVYSHLYKILAEELEVNDDVLAVALLEFQQDCGGTLPHLLEILAEVRVSMPNDSIRGGKARLLELLVRAVKRSGSTMSDLFPVFKTITAKSKNEAEDMEIWHELYDKEVLNGVS